jgi:cell wall-associated NlpC family hydrolase
MALAVLMLAGISLVSPVAANGGSEANRVIAAVSHQIGKPYRWGSTGPSGFDCSGLVYRAFRQAKLARKIGGFNTAHGYFYSFRKKGKTSRSNPRPGDIVVWNNGGHVGIYVGNGKAVSALLSGVKRHKVGGLNIRFTTYIHLGLSSRSSSGASKHKVYRTAAQRLPMRAKAGRSSHLVRSVAKGKRLQVIRTRDRGSRGVWVKVRRGHDTGWVRKSMTRKS